LLRTGRSLSDLRFIHASDMMSSQVAPEFLKKRDIIILYIYIYIYIYARGYERPDHSLSFGFFIIHTNDRRVHMPDVIGV
jgi:hypothetical protein